MGIRSENRQTWREYQAQLQRDRGRRSRPPRSVRLRYVIAVLACIALAAVGLKACYRSGAVQTQEAPDSAAPETSPDAVSGEWKIQKEDIRGWIAPGDIVNLEEKRIDIQVGEGRYLVETSIDVDLQAKLLKRVRNSDAEQMGMVVLDPRDGRILAMVGVDADNSSENPCLDSQFPAASIFKIITATAAIEQRNFSPETELTFNGGKYTLYKSQLKNTVNRYTNTITFRDSFAESVNPVFGKIGTQVGRENLDSYAKAFGFNCDMDFEVDMPASFLEIADGDYPIAEIACGFNRTTTLSPLHGALIAAAVLNGGRMPQPALVERIVDAGGRDVYGISPAIFSEVMAPRTSTLMEGLMRRTVTSGTCRKAFKTASNDRVLSRLDIGAKSGSIDNRQRTRRMDWFVGYAEEKNGSEKLAVAVVVGHGKYIGTKAAEFARYAFRDYFKEYFAVTDKEESKGG